MSRDEKYERYLEARAESLGLPTDPEAYQDGGIAVAGTTRNVQEADLMAAVLNSADIPAWVEGGSTSTWYWYMQYALHPGGIRVLVPTGRLAEAQSLIAEQEQAAKERAGPTPSQPEAAEPDEPEDPAWPLYRRARGLAFLLLIGPLAPVVFVLACRLLVKIRRHRKQNGWSPALRRARRLALVTVILTCPMWGIFLGVIAFKITTHYVIDF
jgi:hypothetical protein